MATSKTSSFWLTEVVSLPLTAVTADRVQGTIDLGAYVDVGDQQAIAIEHIDFIWQRSDSFDQNVEAFLGGNGSLAAQLTDLNPGVAFVRADDNNLIASGALNIDIAANLSTNATDFYPDIFGKLDESRVVVNDQLYLTIGVDGADVGTAALYCTVRIKCRIVKLSTKDWMAIAIQSTASDN